MLKFRKYYLYICLIFLLGNCTKYDPIPSKASIPYEIRMYNMIPKRGDGKEIYLYKNSLILKNAKNPEAYLIILEGALSKDSETYTAHSLAMGIKEDKGVLRKHFQWQLTPCPGTLSIQGNSLNLSINIDVPESSACSEYRGLFEYKSPNTKPVTIKPSEISACHHYQQCACALSSEWIIQQKGPSNPYLKVCDDATRLLTKAADDPTSCQTGLRFISVSAEKLIGFLPKSCQ